MAVAAATAAAWQPAGRRSSRNGQSGPSMATRLSIRVAGRHGSLRSIENWFDRHCRYRLLPSLSLSLAPIRSSPPRSVQIKCPAHVPFPALPFGRSTDQPIRRARMGPSQQAQRRIIRETMTGPGRTGCPVEFEMLISSLSPLPTFLLSS